MYNSKSVKSEEFIDHEEIMKVLEYGEKNKDNSEMVDEILKKAESLVGLDRYEVSVLLYACENKENKELRKKIFAMARKIKEAIYGKRIVMFAPLYVSNYCITAVNTAVITAVPESKERSLLRRKLQKNAVQLKQWVTSELQWKQGRIRKTAILIILSNA